MWLVVMFDLPVVEKTDRKAASDFRNKLLDLGFQISQFSVYMRFATSPAQVGTLCNKIQLVLPQGGHVNIINFTDKQYERIISFTGRTKLPSKKTPDQFDLF
jgi:CRISPR-associated protein Cas2